MATSDCTTKTCNKCGEEHPATAQYFRPETRNAGGFRHQCRNCERIAALEYRRNNLDQQRRTSREWSKRNRDKIAAGVRKWRQNHPERKREVAKAWAARHPEKARAANQRRFSRYKARKLNAPGNHTRQDIEVLYKTQAGRCWYCQCDISEGYEIEHRVPLYRGGSNDIRNIVLACRRCNRSKGAQLPHEWNGRLL